MPKRAKFNREGRIIMAAAIRNTKTSGVPELAEMAGMPYRTLSKRMSVYFGGATIDTFRALARASGLSDEEILEVIKS